METQGYLSFDDAKTTLVNDQFSYQYRDNNNNLRSDMQRYTSKKYVFKLNDVPAAKNEINLWALKDYVSKASFELRSTNFPGSFQKAITTAWKDVDEDFLKSSSFGGNLKRVGWFKDEIQKTELTLARACEIKKLIKSKVQWNEKGSVYTHKLKDALDKGIGNSADMNFLLINALKAGGFDAYAVILSTRGNGRVPLTHPSISAFNYVISAVKIDDKMYYTDASAKFSGWNVLPEKCMVSNARIVSDDYKDWVDISKVSTGIVMKQINVTFEDNMVVLNQKDTRVGNEAYDMKQNYSKFENEDKYLESRSNANNSTIDNFVLTGYDNNNEAVQMEFLEKRDLSLGDEFIYFTPPIDKIFSDNPFKTETRTFPINFDYIRNYVQLVTIKVPANYMVEEFPKSERLVLHDGDMSYTYGAGVTDGIVTLNIRFQLKNLLFLPADYDSVKEFIGKMIQKSTEQIVFKKIAEEDETISI